MPKLWYVRRRPSAQDTHGVVTTTRSQEAVKLPTSTHADGPGYARTDHAPSTHNQNRRRAAAAGTLSTALLFCSRFWLHRWCLTVCSMRHDALRKDCGEGELPQDFAHGGTVQLTKGMRMSSRYPGWPSTVTSSPPGTAVLFPPGTAVLFPPGTAVKLVGIKNQGCHHQLRSRCGCGGEQVM